MIYSAYDTYIFHHIVNGGWGSFKNDSRCSTTCGDGIQKQTKTCDNPKPQNGGEVCRCNGEKECNGMMATIEVGCNLGKCQGIIRHYLKIIETRIML